jgi:hypothetical protein
MQAANRNTPDIAQPPALCAIALRTFIHRRPGSIPDIEPPLPAVNLADSKLACLTMLQPAPREVTPQKNDRRTQPSEFADRRKFGR